MLKYVVLNQCWIDRDGSDFGWDIFNKKQEAIDYAYEVLKKHKNNYFKVEVVVKEIANHNLISKKDFDEYIDEDFFNLIYSKEYIEKLVGRKK